MKKLHNKDFSIAVRTGSDANKSKFAKGAVKGEAYYATDSQNLYFAQSTAGVSDALLSKLEPSELAYGNNYSMSFDGSNDFMTAPDDASLNVSSGFTVSAWIYLNSLNSFQGIASKRDSSGTTFQFYIRDTNILSYYNGSTVYNDTTALSSGVWTHVAITATSNSSASFYIDGSLSSTLSIGVIGSSTSDLYIGQITGVSHLNGKLDDLAVFDTALSGTDVTAIYNSGAPTDLTLAGSYDTDRTANLKGYWRMGDDSSDTASPGGSIATITDSSGNGNDASLQNGPTFSTDVP